MMSTPMFCVYVLFYYVSQNDVFLSNFENPSFERWSVECRNS
jgi:hypothetical protein